MKALSIAALLALVSATTLSTIPANADNCNVGGYHGGFQSSYNNGFNPGFNNGFNPNFNNPYAYGTTANSFRFRGGNPFFNPFAGNINGRQTAINNRIQQGISNGRLNQREATKLQNRYNQIATLEAQLRTSGNRLSFSERARLNNDLNRLQGQLSRDLNDRRWFW
jgi:hypothetical protein